MELPKKRRKREPKPPQEIEVSEKHLTLRVVLLALAVTITIGSLVYGINSLTTTEPGMQEIEVQAGKEKHCGDSFTLYYDLGRDGRSATAERQDLRKLYSQAAVDGFRIFDAYLEFEDCRNVCYLNGHVNETVVVDPALYKALTLLEESGTRYHYLAPMYEMYEALFQCTYDQEVQDYDPYESEALRAFYAETARYTQDPAQISLDLMGDGKVCLRISEEYLAYAKENGITRFLDLGWMQNAFLCDYLADTLLANGFTHATLVSCDGFARQLDGGTLSYGLYHLEALTLSPARLLELEGPASLAYLHGYPLGEGDAGSYFVREDGAIRSSYLDPADGLCKSALPEMAAWSQDGSCARLALALGPVFIADSLDLDALESLVSTGAEIWYADENPGEKKAP